MRITPLSLLCFLASACMCDPDCIDGDRLRFSLIDSDGNDYLLSHNLEYDHDVRLFIKRKGVDRKSVYQNHSVAELIRGDTVNSVIFALDLDDEIEWVYFELDGTIRDSVTMDYSITNDDCCGDISRIETINYHHTIEPFVAGDTASFAISP